MWIDAISKDYNESLVKHHIVLTRVALSRIQPRIMTHCGRTAGKMVLNSVMELCDAANPSCVRYSLCYTTLDSCSFRRPLISATGSVWRRIVNSSYARRLFPRKKELEERNEKKPRPFFSPESFSMLPACMNMQHMRIHWALLHALAAPPRC